MDAHAFVRSLLSHFLPARSIAADHRLALAASRRGTKEPRRPMSLIHALMACACGASAAAFHPGDASIGACCFFDGDGIMTCDDLSPLNCAAAGGSWQSGPCAATVCTLGSCCLPDSNICADSTQAGVDAAWCASWGGLWLEGFACQAVTCPPDCHPDAAVTDGEFDVNALTTYGTVLSDFALHAGKWGAETGAITTAENGVTPLSGTLMLRMNPSGGIATQTVQVVDLTLLAADIDSGTIAADFSASFNVPTGAAAASAYPMVRFFTSASYASLTGSVGSGSVLDTDVTSWQRLAVTTSVPAGTRWMVLEVGFNVVSLSGLPGYVDDAALCIRRTNGGAWPESCTEDISGDGIVDLGDLLALLAAWGTCDGCPSDIDGSGTVDLGDLLALLGNWGPCG
jgi:hypothetical protein